MAEQTGSVDIITATDDQQQQQGPVATATTSAPKSGTKKSGKGKKRPKPVIGGSGLIAKVPQNLSAARRVLASADRLACERCHQEQRPLPPEYVYVWVGRCQFQGLDIYVAYRRLQQDNHVFFQADHGTCIDIADIKILNGKLVKGPPEDFSRQRMVSFGTIMDSAKNVVRRKFSKFKSFILILQNADIRQNQIEYCDNSHSIANRVQME